MINIIISENYSKTPGGREKAEGPFSGEDFRETILREKFLLALEKKEKLFIDFDNTYGFAPSFIEEAFGGLIRELDFEKGELILSTLEMKSNDDLIILDWVKNDINKALKAKRGGK